MLVYKSKEVVDLPEWYVLMQLLSLLNERVCLCIQALAGHYIDQVRPYSIWMKVSLIYA